MEKPSGVIFSVVIPLYNKEKHIQRAINSVLFQTYQNFELIIVDDGSTDGSFEAASAIHDARIRIIRQENKGVSAARNRGILEADTEWIAFLDADDEWLPAFLEEIYELMIAYPECNVLASAYLKSEEGGKLCVIQPSISTELGWSGVLESYIASIQADTPFFPSSIVVRKSALLEVGMFPDGIKLTEDLTTWLRLSLYNKIAYKFYPLAIYHRDAENRSWLHFPEYELEVVKVGKQLLASGQLDETENKLLYASLVRSEIGRARALIYAGKKKEAREVLLFCKDSLNNTYTVKKLLQWTFSPTWLYRKFFSLKSRLKMLIAQLDRVT
jgi:glycosyltransferase involved in cell wall biosynthesis